MLLKELSLEQPHMKLGAAEIERRNGSHLPYTHWRALRSAGRGRAGKQEKTEGEETGDLCLRTLASKLALDCYDAANKLLVSY